MNGLQTFFAATRTKVVGGAFALLMVGGVLGAVVATAAPSFAAANHTNGKLTTKTTTGNGPAKYCQVYEQSLEKQLQVSQAQLETANQQALKDALAAAVKDGKLTQAQADQVNQKIAANGTNVCDHIGQFLGKHAGHQGMPGAFGAIGPQLMQIHTALQTAVATKLHISTSDLQTSLASTDLVTLAKQHNVTQSDLNSTIQATVKTQLDGLVKAGTLTSDQETQALTFLTAQINAGQYGLLGLGQGAPQFG